MKNFDKFREILNLVEGDKVEGFMEIDGSLSPIEGLFNSDTWIEDGGGDGSNPLYKPYVELYHYFHDNEYLCIREFDEVSDDGKDITIKSTLYRNENEYGEDDYDEDEDEESSVTIILKRK